MSGVKASSARVCGATARQYSVPLEGAGSINQALRALGVQPAAGIEEFELVGLTRHRSPDEWLQDAG